MKRVTVITGARSDYGIYLPILRRFQSDPEFELDLIVCGMHLAPEFGMTIREIEKDGFEVRDRVDMLLASDSPEAIAKSMGLGVLGFSQAYARQRPGMLLTLGDRFEMLAGVVASLPFKIPVAHVHGGETTEGAIDESIRHSITKMSHLHFASTADYARRIIQLGEDPERVQVTGAPALDHLHDIDFLSHDELAGQFGIDVSEPPLLVTFHPATLRYEDTETHIQELLGALEQADRPVVFTYPNADTSGRVIIEHIEAFVGRTDRAIAVRNLGTRAYFSLMHHAAAMVGNSSSGIIEAASFRLPVVNIGDRQHGRVQGGNVVNVGHARAEIIEGIGEALSPAFRTQVNAVRNPYGDGTAAEQIVEGIRGTSFDDELIRKRFYDIEWQPVRNASVAA